MALIQVPVTEKNRKSHSKTYLFNTENVGDFYADGTSTVFFYVELTNGRRKPVEYKTSTGKTAFETLMDSTLYDNRMDVSAAEKTVTSKETFSKTVNIDVNKVIKGWDIDTTSCYLEVESGGFRVVKYKLNHVIADLESASSTSVSVV